MYQYKYLNGVNRANIYSKNSVTWVGCASHYRLSMSQADSSMRPGTCQVLNQYLLNELMFISVVASIS